ncbi:MAG: hypothetical protein ACI8WT_002187 [Clostridium sp.]|jgi:hypothetical protein
MEHTKLNKIKKGKVIVNICIIIMFINIAWSFVEKNSKGDKNLIILEIILSCVFLGIVLCYYVGNKGAVSIIISFVQIILAILPFTLIKPAMYLFNMLFYDRLGEWALAVVVSYYVIGIIIIYILFKKFDLFNCVKEYKYFRTTKLE